jgi:protein-L-isoaspartate(D-aspartate) O-methyltransferase
MQDTYRHKGLRKELVQVLRNKNITDENVLSAIGNIPRHLFIGESVFDEDAYTDKAFPIGEGQTISQPFTVAYQSQLLNVKRGEKILEVGTGSGYQAAVLSVMGAKVFTIERHKKLYERTKPLLMKLGYHVKCFFGDGYEGLPLFAPFEKIIITAAAPEIPHSLLDQLVIGGFMVIPFENEGVTEMLRITRKSAKVFDQEIFDRFAFVPMLKGKVY